MLPWKLAGGLSVDVAKIVPVSGVVVPPEFPTILMFPAIIWSSFLYQVLVEDALL